MHDTCFYEVANELSLMALLFFVLVQLVRGLVVFFSIFPHTVSLTTIRYEVSQFYTKKYTEEK